MNLLGHLVVTGRTGGDERAQLGALLPDALHLVGLRTPGDLPEELAIGVASHHRADGAFHSHPDTLAGMGALRQAIVELGVANGPARAAGHIAFEMLLDGVLVDDDVLGAWEAAWAHAAEVDPHLDAAGAARWGDLREAVARGSWAGRYAETDWVADRVVAICDRRPRLRLGCSPAELATVLVPPSPARAGAICDDVVFAMSSHPDGHAAA